jgi:trehalose 6-phosphate synthase
MAQASRRIASIPDALDPDLRGQSMSGPGRLILVSNRLPIRTDCVDGENRLQPSSGGLVPALVPILRESGGCWVGWTGTDYDETVSDLVRSSAPDYLLEPVFLTTREEAGYYRGFSNEILWPLFHDVPSRCRFNSAYWKTYCQVNEKFADTVGRVSQQNDFIWVHDYHLMLQAQALRARGFRHDLTYFHHVPFPCPEVFRILPWRDEILQALTHFNTLGFQTLRDRDNFIACLRHYLSGVQVCHETPEAVTVRVENQYITVGAYPISINYEDFAAVAADPAVNATAQAIKNKLGDVRLILGVDRLDYTKGIPERLMAFQEFLERYPEQRGRVTMLQIAVPSREEIPEYRDLKVRIENAVTRINGQYAVPGWTPIQYFYRSISRAELIAFYRAADVALVTPLKDGMNLIAKEFCASRTDSQGVLILSEFAGAAEELRRGALVVNPYHTELVATLIQRALRMTEGEQRMRMNAMRSHVQLHDVFCWAQLFNISRLWNSALVPA